MRRLRCGVRGALALLTPAVLTRAVLTLALLAGCGGKRQPAAEFLNVYSWTDYIAPGTVARFERETGIKVRYDTYESNEVLETKLLTGHTNYDIVIPTDTFFERLVRAGVFQRLDFDALPNRANLDPEIMRRLELHDPGNAHAIPYLWSTVGLGFDRRAVRARLGDEPPDSWSLLFDPAQAAKFKDCGISLIDSPGDVFAAVLVYLGKDPNSRDPADAADAAAVLARIRPFVRSIDSTQYISDLANGSLCLSLGWSGDIMQARDRAREAGSGADIVYLLPREGSMLIVDMMGIPADAPHPRNALTWMNFLMRPDVIAEITNHVKYPNGNAAATPLVDAALKRDPAVYPDTAARGRLRALLAEPPEFSRLQTRLWTSFRTGQ